MDVRHKVRGGTLDLSAVTKASSIRRLNMKSTRLWASGRPFGQSPASYNVTRSTDQTNTLCTQAQGSLRKFSVSVAKCTAE